MERKNVMIWGGTRGLGRELARQSVARGNRTVVTGRKVPHDYDVETHGRFVRANFSAVGDPSVPGGDDVDGMFYQASLNADVLFWVVGHWLRKPFYECAQAELVELMNVH